MKYSGAWVVIYKVIWIYLLAISFLLFPLYALDYFFEGNLVDYIWNTVTGLGLIHLAGILGLSYAIWEGDFVDSVKPSHWIWEKIKEGSQFSNLGGIF